MVRLLRQSQVNTVLCMTTDASRIPHTHLLVPACISSAWVQRCQKDSVVTGRFSGEISNDLITAKKKINEFTKVLFFCDDITNLMASWERTVTATRNGTGTIGNNGPWSLSLSQTRHFQVELYFPYGPCTSPGLIPAQCECTINVYKTDRW